MEEKKIDVKEILEQQLAIDYDCSIEEVRSSEHVFRPMKWNEGARPIGEEGMGFRLAVYNEKYIIMADEETLNWCKENLAGKEAEWMSMPHRLIALNEQLNKVGQKLVDAHHFYIPGKTKIEVECPYELKVYNQEEILQFKGDNRFDEAFLFDENMPDMIGVAAVENGVLLGMAGATCDAPEMWQLGINVMEEGKGKGIGSMLVAALKNEVEKAGKVPFYSTAESHIKSQKVAIQTGFIPAFFEIFSEKM